MSVVPGSFDQKTSDVDVARLGDGSTIFFITGGSFRGHETEVGHESSGGSEAADIIDFTEKSQGGKGFDAAQTTECLGLESELIGQGKAFELSIHGVLLSFKILKVFEFDGQSGLEWAVEAVPE